MQKSAILTTVGVLEQPLGNARLHVARLVASLLQTSDTSICQELCKLNTMDLLLVRSSLFIFTLTWSLDSWFSHFLISPLPPPPHFIYHLLTTSLLLIVFVTCMFVMEKIICYAVWTKAWRLLSFPLENTVQHHSHCDVFFVCLLQDLFFKYTWNNFLHFQVEMCVTSILNHSAHTSLHASVLPNHEEKPDSDSQNSSTDAPHAPTHDALVANVIAAAFQL